MVVDNVNVKPCQKVNFHLKFAKAYMSIAIAALFDTNTGIFCVVSFSTELFLHCYLFLVMHWFPQGILFFYFDASVLPTQFTDMHTPSVMLTPVY